MWGAEFLKALIDKVPVPVRVVAFLVVLMASVYLTLLPQFVNGYVYFKDGNGGKRAYRGGEIVVSVDGHVYKYLINEDGYFSVPMISKLPKDIRLGFIHQDTGGRFDILVPFKRVASLEELHFEVNSAPPSFNLLAARPTGRDAVLAFLEKWTGVSGAFAAELRLPEGANPISTAQAGEIRKDVLTIVSRESAKPMDQLRPSTEFTWGNGFPYITKIRIVDSLEAKYHFQIPDSHWQAFRTVDDVVDYTQKRVVLDTYKPSAGKSWPQYQNDVSKESPLFVK
jgi:acyl carrier protein